MDPQQAFVANEFDSYRNSYAQTINNAIGFGPLRVDRFVRAKATDLSQRVVRHFGDRKSLSVVDIGCGIGQYHPLISESFGQITGVDVSTEAVARARELNPFVDYHTYDGATLPFANGEFDVAFAVCVLHHVPVDAWGRFVSEMRRVVKAGGLCFLYEHNPNHPLTKRVVSRCPFDANAVLLKPAASLNLFMKAGFETVDVDHILTIPTISGMPKRIDRALSVFRFGTQYCLQALR